MAITKKGSPMAPDLHREPPYMQIAAFFRKKIAQGELQPGDHILSVTQIMSEWRVSRATASRALSVLAAEGLAEGHPGIGTIVCGPAKKSGAEADDPKS